MKSSCWRHYRGHLIVKSRGFLGLERFELWDRRTLLGTFASVVRAELYADRRIAAAGRPETPATGSGTLRPH